MWPRALFRNGCRVKLPGQPCEQRGRFETQHLREKLLTDQRQRELETGILCGQTA